MKKKAVIASILIPIVFYFGGSFIEASFNILNWAQLTRGLIGSIIILGILFPQLIALTESKKDE